MASNTHSVDPAADLDLLNRSQAAGPADQFLDFGPWWYAPLLATTLGGATLFGRAFDGLWNVPVGAAAVGSGIVMAVHDYRRRGMRMRWSRHGAGPALAIVLISWALVASWGTALSSLGHERFVPVWAVVAWVLTTAVLLLIRAVLLAIRARRAPLQ